VPCCVLGWKARPAACSRGAVPPASTGKPRWRSRRRHSVFLHCATRRTLNVPADAGTAALLIAVTPLVLTQTYPSRSSTLEDSDSRASRDGERDRNRYERLNEDEVTTVAGYCGGAGGGGNDFVDADGGGATASLEPSPSPRPALNSCCALPRFRANFGSCEPPNSTRTTTRMMISWGPPTMRHTVPALQERSGPVPSAPTISTPNGA
jgi:hypothetical protein